MEDLDRSDIEQLIFLAQKIKKEGMGKRVAHSFISGLLFFQESTRTRIGFQVASYRLGGDSFILKETRTSDSMLFAAESVEDTVKVLQSYTDIICIRHSDNDICTRLLPISKKPLINCGNGDDEHPSQTLIDLMAIKELCGSLDNLSIAIVGDLRHMRAAHSLILGLSKFVKMSVRCISPKELSMPEKYKNVYINSGNILTEMTEMNLNDVDVVYMAGFQPKTPVKTISKKIRLAYQANKTTLAQLKDKSIILCPLPRIDEIKSDVDQTKFAKYFEQSDLGLYMRMAIVKWLL